MVSERRVNPRLRAYLPIRLHKANPPQVIETLNKDLSLGGVRCVSSTLCPVLTDMGVELILPHGEEQLSMRGKTAWFLTIPDSDQFDLGIIFTELSPQDKRRLSVYLERIASRNTLLTV